MRITPPSVEAVKNMPLQSTSSDGSDLDSLPNFSLTEEFNRSKVAIANDPEKSLDISAATQGKRMVTAVEVWQIDTGDTLTIQWTLFNGITSGQNSFILLDS